MHLLPDEPGTARCAAGLPLAKTLADPGMGARGRDVVTRTGGMCRAGQPAPGRSPGAPDGAAGLSG
jgi:hypothetical protein